MYTLNDADSAKDVPFEGLDDENNAWGSKPSKNAFSAKFGKFSNSHISESSSAIGIKF